MFTKMNWQDYIISDKEILLGKPIVKGTRISVDLILELLELGWSQEQILNSYPMLSRDALKAVFYYLRDSACDKFLFQLTESN